MVVLLIGQVVNTATGASGIMLSMTGRSLYVLFNTGGVFLFNIALTLILVNRFGVIGAAYAYSASIITIQLLQLVQVWYLYGIHPYSMNHIKPVFSCLLSVSVIYFLKDIFYSQNQIVSILILAGTFMLCYIALLILTGLANEDKIVFDQMRTRFLEMLAKSAK